MKYLISIAFFIFSTSLILAQSVNISGYIKEKNKKKSPMAMANVIVVNNETKKIETYCVSSNNGFYRLKVNKNAQYKIRISFIGYKTVEHIINTKDSDVKKNFIMEESKNMMNQVNVVHTMPVSVKGDTIVYDADSFKVGTEKKLKDVLENLPGVEINDDGQIEVEGKKVQKLMVEGKEFFDGDTKIAANNLPANAVDKVQVLRNYNEISQMKGLSFDEDNVALNIKLKDGKKRFWFGEVTGAGGTEEAYLTNQKAFFYSPEFSINAITDINNIGELPMTRRDFMNFSGGFKNMHSRSGSNFGSAGNMLGISTLQNNKAKDINTKFGALNFSASPSKKLNFGGFGIYSFNGTDVEKHSAKIYKTEANNGLTENTINITNQDVDLGLYKFNTEYKPNTNFQFNYDAFFKMSSDDELRKITSEVNNVNNTIDEIKTQKPKSFKQSSEIYYTLNNDNVFAFNGTHNYSEENPLYSSYTNNFAFSNLLPVNTLQENYKLNQDKNIKNNKLDLKLDYFRILNKKSNLQLTLGLISSNQQYNTSIFQLLDNNEIYKLNTIQSSNNVDFDISDLYAELHYKIQLGQFTFNPGIGLHKFDMSYKGSTNKTDDFYEFLPDMYINWQIRKSQNIRFKYSITRSFSDVTKYAEGIVLNNYNSLYMGNPELESSLNHKYSLNFFSFDMFNYTHMFANISYSKKINSIKSKTELVNVNYVGTNYNSDLNDENLSGSARYSRTFRYFKAGARTGVNWSKSYYTINNKLNSSESTSFNYNVSLSTNFKKLPNIKVGYKYSESIYNKSSTKNTYYTQRPYISLDARFLRDFTLTADFNYYDYSDKNNTTNDYYNFLEAELTYQKKDSNWELSVLAKNLTKMDFRNQNSESDFYFSSTSYFVRDPYYLFTLKYKF